MTPEQEEQINTRLDELSRQAFWNFCTLLGVGFIHFILLMITIINHSK